MPMSQYRSGKRLSLFTDATASGSWTPLTNRETTDDVMGVEITGVLAASGSYTTDKLASGSFGARREDYPAFREPGTAAPSGLLGAGFYLSPPSGTFIQLRDANDDVFYTAYYNGTPSPVEGGATIDYLSSSITLQLPISYWCNQPGESCMIRVFGEYK